MGEEHLESENCFGHYEKNDRHCSLCILDKDCRKERNKRERKKKLAEADTRDRILTKREKDRWMAMQLIEVAKSLIESEKVKADKLGGASKDSRKSRAGLASLDYSI